MTDNSKSNNKPAKSRNSQSTYLANQLGKVPPQVIELEEAVLGALMIEKDALTDIIDVLKPNSFYKPAHQEIYQAIFELFSESQPVDMLTVTQQLRKMAKLEMVGGPSYIMKLTSMVNSAANIEYHARIITEQAIKRDLIAISSEIQKEAFEDSSDVFTLLDKAEQALFDISENNIRKNYADMRSIMQDAIRELEERRDQKDGLTGVPTGLTALDRVTAGWQKSDLVILAARPAMGKTAFSLTVLRNAAVDFGKPVAFFSLEMSAVQLTNRLISSEAQIESEKIKKGQMEPHEWEILYQKIATISEAPIFIDDTPALSILELRAKCRRLKAQHDIQLVIIDYLQLMTGNTGKGGAGNREQEIASISRALKQLAKELDVPVIALSQLSRAVETRGGDKRPQLSDLRESGSIEQDADMVAFLYRAEYYGITEDATGNSTAGVGEVMIAKHRNGSLADIPLRFIGKYTKFEDLETDTFGMDMGGGSFPSGGSSEFDMPSTMTFSSKINEPKPDTPPSPPPNDDLPRPEESTGSIFPPSNLDDDPPF